ncbi:MAG: phosphonate metabolism transcriptional regulator PhnF [Pikeienuella sp.]
MTDADRTRSLPLWQQILQTLSNEIDDGLYPPGAKLPTEAELSKRFGVNRHTVRRALEGLRTDGRIHVRRGSGAFVTQGRLDYQIGPRTRLSQNLADRGRSASRIWLRIEEVTAQRVEAKALEIEEGAPLLVTEVIGTADEVPISYARSSFPLDRLVGLTAAVEDERSITKALARIGISDYRRLWTRLTAERPGVMMARHLMMPEIHPVLLAEGLNVCPEGRPIEFGRTWFCSDRIQLVVDSATFAAESDSFGDVR